MTAESEITKSPFYILFVDDEDNARKYFEKGFKHGFNILTAANVEEAQKIVAERHHELAVVVTDQRMPGGNGVKLLRFLRENYPHIIRLLTTAYSDLSEAIEAVNSGEIFRYVQKPWDFGLLKTELNQAMELFELRLERNQLLHEKIMVRRKMIKIDRVKSLLLIAKCLEQIRFAERSVKNFIKTLSTMSDAVADSNWESFDLGKSDVLEAEFVLNMAEKIRLVLPREIAQEINDQADITNIVGLLEQEKINANSSAIISTTDQEKENSSIKTNLGLLQILFTKLLQISTLSDSPSNSFSVQKSKDGISLTLKSEQTKSELKTNLLSVCPNDSNSDFHINLLICALLVGHLGGAIDFTFENNNFTSFVTLPSIQPQAAELGVTSLDTSIDNIILGVMLS